MKVAIYVRISRSDDNNHHNSIDNQIKGITDYCKTHKYPITKIYKDINVSGKTMNRPEFNLMMNDVDSGLIDTIIVKDLSRFGRNHLEVGTYLDDIFLVNNIRFISIDDNYDNKGVIDEFVTFKNIFNEMYLKDLRKKIKSTFDYKAKTKLLNPRPGAFYGLTVDEYGNYIIDEYAANIVRRIYSLYIARNSTKAIAKLLANEGVVAPGHYRYIKYNDKSSVKNEDQYKWKDCTIYKILTNEEYLGKIINRKYLYINGKKILNPDPIIIENALPQIIDEEIFYKAQDIRLNRPKKKDKVYINPYPDMVRCGCCNKVMRYTYSQTMNQNLYTCRRCNTRIYIDDLKFILTEDIKDQISKIDNKEINNHNEHSIKKIKREIKLIDSKIQSSFEEFAKGEISEDDLKLIINDLTIKKNKLLLSLEQGNSNINKMLSNLISEEINDVLISKLVSSVLVINTGRRKYDIHINYNFKN